MINYKVIERDYYNQDDIELEITETLEAPVVKTTISVSNLKQKVANLEKERDAKTAEYNEQIEKLQNTITETQEIVNNVILKEVVEPLTPVDEIKTEDGTSTTTEEIIK